MEILLKIIICALALIFVISFFYAISEANSFGEVISITFLINGVIGSVVAILWIGLAWIIGISMNPMSYLENREVATGIMSEPDSVEQLIGEIRNFAQSEAPEAYRWIRNAEEEEEILHQRIANREIELRAGKGGSFQSDPLWKEWMAELAKLEQSKEQLQVALVEAFSEIRGIEQGEGGVAFRGRDFGILIQ